MAENFNTGDKVNVIVGQVIVYRGVQIVGHDPLQGDKWVVAIPPSGGLDARFESFKSAELEYAPPPVIAESLPAFKHESGNWIGTFGPFRVSLWMSDLGNWTLSCYLWDGADYINLDQFEFMRERDVKFNRPFLLALESITNSLRERSNG